MSLRSPEEKEFPVKEEAVLWQCCCLWLPSERFLQGRVWNLIHRWDTVDPVDSGRSVKETPGLGGEAQDCHNHDWTRL